MLVGIKTSYYIVVGGKSYIASPITSKQMYPSEVLFHVSKNICSIYLVQYRGQLYLMTIFTGIAWVLYSTSCIHPQPGLHSRTQSNRYRLFVVVNVVTDYILAPSRAEVKCTLANSFDRVQLILALFNILILVPFRELLIILMPYSLVLPKYWVYPTAHWLTALYSHDKGTRPYPPHPHTTLQKIKNKFKKKYSTSGTLGKTEREGQCCCPNFKTMTSHT